MNIEMKKDVGSKKILDCYALWKVGMGQNSQFHD